MRDRLILVFVLLYFPIIVQATDYYVGPSGSDANTPAQAQNPSTPWATINHAASVIVAGDTVHVLPGTYNISSTISTSVSGTAGAPITYISDTKWGAQIIFVAALDSCWFNTGDYVIINGFDITENASTGSCRLGLRTGGDHPQILHNRVHDLNKDAQWQTCGSGGAAGFLIENYENHNAGNGILDGNVASGNGGATSGWSNHNCVHAHGFYLNQSNLLVINNIAIKNEAFGFTDCGHSPCVNVTAINNTTYNNGYGAYTVGTDTGSVDYVANNIFSEASARQGVTYCYGNITSPGGSTITFSNNDIPGLSLSNAYYCGNLNTKPATTINNPLSSDPQFVNISGDGTIPGTTSDYHLQASSPAINAGTSSQAPNHDFDGNTRPQVRSQGSGFDIGSDEFVTASSTITPPTNLAATVH